MNQEDFSLLNSYLFFLSIIFSHLSPVSDYFNFLSAYRLATVVTIHIFCHVMLFYDHHHHFFFQFSLLPSYPYTSLILNHSNIFKDTRQHTFPVSDFSYSSLIFLFFLKKEKRFNSPPFQPGIYLQTYV